MSYQGISIREVVHKINAPANGWYLPATQRLYVWGSRYEGELYICKLFDSLLRSYPIGGLLVWQTPDRVPFRTFLTEYESDAATKIVDEGLWGREDKSLVYDGQQRLQTLYSCLRYTFNGKVLTYDLTFSLADADADQDQTGFSFRDKDVVLPHLLRMNELFC